MDVCRDASSRVYVHLSTRLAYNPQHIRLALPASYGLPFQHMPSVVMCNYINYCAKQEHPSMECLSEHARITASLKLLPSISK